MPKLDTASVCDRKKDLDSDRSVWAEYADRSEIQRTSVERVRRLVRRGLEQQKGLTSRGNAGKWRLSRIAASSFIVESAIWLRATGSSIWG